MSLLDIHQGTSSGDLDRVRAVDRGRSPTASAKYAAQLKTVLSSFDNIVDWPDTITFLGRLAKTIQSQPEVPNLPHKLLISRRLAQCLNPSLPAGVHQKALEVLDLIFTTIGPGNLAKDTHIWTFGFWPYFELSPMSVKPLLLHLVESHLVPLRHRLHPILKSLIMALLSGLEEEDSEHFEAHLQLLDRIRKQVDESEFFLALWSVSGESSAARRPAMVYFIKRVSAIRGDPSLVSACLGKCLTDSDVLVQRASLDLLAARYPLHRLDVEFPKAALHSILGQALQVVLKRDMSLNRRLYAWLIGEGTNHFELHSEKPLVSTLCGMLGETSPARVVIALKVMIPLLDRNEMAAPILTQVMPSVIDLAWRTRISSPELVDVAITVKMFFSLLDPFWVWRDLNFRIASDAMGTLPIVEYFASQLTAADDDGDVLSSHLPLAVLHLLLRCHTTPSDELTRAIRFALDLAPRFELDCSPQSMLPAPTPEQILQVYGGTSQGIPRKLHGGMFLKHVEQCIEAALLATAWGPLSLLTDLLRQLKVPPSGATWVFDALGRNMVAQAIVPLIGIGLLLPPATLEPHSARAVQALVHALATADSAPLAHHAVELLWSFLGTDPRMMACLVKLISAGMSEPGGGFQAFGLFWKLSADRDPVLLPALFSEPLLAVLVAYGDKSRRHLAEQWVSSYLASFCPLFDVLLLQLDECTPSVMTETSTPKNSVFLAVGADFELQTVTFLLQQLLAVFDMTGRNAAIALLSTRRQKSSSDTKQTYFDAILDHACRLAITFPVPIPAQLSELHLLALQVLSNLVFSCRIRLSELVIARIAGTVLACLDAWPDPQLNLHPLALEHLSMLILMEAADTSTTSTTTATLRKGLELGSSSNLNDPDSVPLRPTILSPRLKSSEVIFEAVLVRGLTEPVFRPVLGCYTSFVADCAGQFGPLLVPVLHALSASVIRELAKASDELAMALYLRSMHGILQHVLVPRRAYTGAMEAPTVPDSSSSSTQSQLTAYMRTLVLTASPSDNKPVAAAATGQLHAASQPPIWILKEVFAIGQCLVRCLHVVYDRMFAADSRHTSAERPFLEHLLRRVTRVAKFIVAAQPTLWITCVLTDAIENQRPPARVVETSLMDARTLFVDALALVPEMKSGKPTVLSVLGYLGHDQVFKFCTQLLRSRLVLTSVLTEMQALCKSSWSSVSPDLVTLISTACVLAATEPDWATKDAVDLFGRALDSVSAAVALVTQQSKEDQIDFIVALVDALRDSALPALVQVYTDPDRANAALGNLIVFVGLPLARLEWFPQRAPLRSLVACSQLSTSRTWRRDLWDYYLSSRLLPLNPTAQREWSDFLRLFESDRVSDLLSKLAPATSSTLFGSREQEMAARIEILRRISLLVWAHPVDRHLPLLPVVQEKITEYLATIDHAGMFSELLLLVRVLAVRVSAAHLTGIWAVLVGEMLAVLDQWPAPFSPGLIAVDGAAPGITPALEEKSLAVCHLLSVAIRTANPAFQVYVQAFVGHPSSPGVLLPLSRAAAAAAADDLLRISGAAMPELSATGVAASALARELISMGQDQWRAAAAASDCAVEKAVEAEVFAELAEKR
ncbi:Dopey, N-terminal-domain-containing protein [Blastocladiella britannica]|nr:Dopey, N-terminal-domain-containing protein [Blastocladiella britannica]